MESKRKALRDRGVTWYIVLAALILTAVGIYCFSAQTGDESGKFSEAVARFLFRLVGKDYNALTAVQKSNVQYYIRKGAHFLEYTALGLFLHLFLSSFVKKRSVSSGLSLVLGAVYAATDEYHQLVVGSRSAQWQDVALDSAGVLFGLLIALLLLHLREKKKQEKQNTV